MGRAMLLTNTHVHGWWSVGAGAIDIELDAAEVTFWTLLTAALSSPRRCYGGEMFFVIFAAIGQFSGRIISDRKHEGLAAARA